jgi:uroporphyrinogen III methyltransferase / synthase
VNALAGKRVLVTRPRGDAAEMAAGLSAAGAEAVLAPTIEFGPPDDPVRADIAVREVRVFHWIVFTSRHGVEAFFERLAAAGRDTRALGDTAVAAIGPKTAELLTQYGVRADFVPERFVNEEVAAGLLERSRPGERILIFRAQDAREVLPALLEAEGRRVDDVAAYATHAVRDANLRERARETDVWTFTSAGTVRGFLANVPEAAQLAGERTVACIGPVTAEAARAGGLPVHVVPEIYTAAGLLAALSEFGTPAAT